MNLIVYTGSTTIYPNPTCNLPLVFDDYKNPSNIVLSLLDNYLRKGYCVTLDNYYTFAELAKALLFCNVNCYVTPRRKQGLPKDFWDWKPEKRKQQK